MMIGAGDMMEESYDEAGIRPRYNGPEKGKHLSNIFILLVSTLKSITNLVIQREFIFAYNRNLEYQYHWRRQ